MDGKNNEMAKAMLKAIKTEAAEALLAGESDKSRELIKKYEQYKHAAGLDGAAV